MVGACGGVGSTVSLGLAALRKGLAPTTGMVTALPDFEGLGLVGADGIVVGGHEIRTQTLSDASLRLHSESHVFAPDLVRKCTKELQRDQKNIKPGVVLGSIGQIKAMADGKFVRRVRTGIKAVEVVRRDLDAFRSEHRLDHVVVVNVASSEPPLREHASHKTYELLSAELKRSESDAVPSSSLYALGAIAAGCSYVNFTPSTGMRIAAIEQRANECGVLYAGRDGKTGETLMKSVLAPMFAQFAHSQLGGSQPAGQS
jgi:myo-inositol-1-phosphate synthase